MRWPWVSRAEYEDLRERGNAEGRSLRADRDELQRMLLASETALTAERARYESLLEKYHALKLQGASEPQSLQPAPKREPDPVVQAINVMSRGNPQLRAQMLRAAEVDRRSGRDDAAIINAINTGEPVFLDGVPA